MKNENRPLDLERRLLSSIRSADDVLYCRRAGITHETFFTPEPDHGAVWEYIEQHDGDVSDEDLGSLHEFKRTKSGDLKTYVEQVRVLELKSKARDLVINAVDPLEADPRETISALTQSLIDLQASTYAEIPTVESTSDGWGVIVPFRDGQIRLGFRNLISVGTKLIADVTVRHVKVPGLPDKVFSERCDLLSNSAKNNFRLSLDRYFGQVEKNHWFRVLTDAVQLVLEQERTQDEIVDMSKVSSNADVEWLAWPLVLKGEPTTLFGDAESGKTWLGLYLAICLTKGLKFMGRTLKPTNVLYIDFESRPETVKRRVRRLLTGLGLDEGDIWDRLIVFDGSVAARTFEYSIHSLRSRVKKHKIELTIVDTAGDACMGDLISAEIVIRYFLNVSKLGVATLNIAHINRAGDQQTPYGSIFWRNKSRLMWNTQGKLDPNDSNIKHVMLAARKFNEGAPLETQWLTFHFQPPKDQGPVIIKRSLTTPSAFEDKLPLRERIIRQLGEGEKTVEELAGVLDTPRTQIKSRLTELAQQERVFNNRLTHTWRLSSQPEDEGESSHD